MLTQVNELLTEISENASNFDNKISMNTNDPHDKGAKNCYTRPFRVTSKTLVEFFNHKISADKTFDERGSKIIGYCRKKICIERGNVYCAGHKRR